MGANLVAPPPLLFIRLADARVQANERFLGFQDTDFEYQRARLNLMRATGELEKWAMGVQK